MSASALPIRVGGHPVYGLEFVSHSPTGVPCLTAATCVGSHGQAYNNGNVGARGVAVGAQPEGTYGYSPMRKEAPSSFGSGGDQGTTDGEFFEGAMTYGVPPPTAHAAVQANIAAVGYAMR